MSQTYTTEAPPKASLNDFRAGGSAMPSPANSLTVSGNSGPVFDIDAYHAMEERDNALIADEVISGALSTTFVYSLPGGKDGDITGVSVAGARHLAFKYGKIKHRILGSILKKDAMFISTNYPHDGTPFGISCSSIPEMRHDPDFYKVLIEITDMSTGNSIQVEKLEMRYEERRDKSGYFERKHVETIAQSKAFRNGILALLPQDVIATFKRECLALMGTDRKAIIITENVLDQKRSNVIGYAIRNAIAIDRAKLASLSLAEINGLSKAAHEDGIDTFRRALMVLGVAPGNVTEIKSEPRKPAPKAEGKTAETAAATETSKTETTPKTEPEAGQGDTTSQSKPDPEKETKQETVKANTEAAGKAAQAKVKPSQTALFGADDEDDEFGNTD
jgi:hypothetical protein